MGGIYIRYLLENNEIEEIVEILLNKYNLSTRFLNELYGYNRREMANDLLNKAGNINLDRYNICKLIVINNGINLLAIRELREELLKKLEDSVIEALYSKYPDKSSNINNVSYMRKPLGKRKWISGKGWAKDFVKATGLPKVLAGIGDRISNNYEAVQIIHPRRKVPTLVPYQVEVKNKLLEVLRLEADKTRCMISIPTGGGKTRVAVEAFLEWMISSFEEEKYMLWIAQSEELCEQCISCIEQMWSEMEFVLPLSIYRAFGKYNIDNEMLQGGVVVASINKLYNGVKNTSTVVDEILTNTGAMIIDEAHRATSMMYDVVFNKAEELTSGKLFPVCGLTATPGRNTIVGDSDVNKLVDRFCATLITPQFKNNEKYNNNPLEYFKEEGYLAKVNHIVYKSNIEYKLTEEELRGIEAEQEYSPAHLKTLAEDTNRNRLIINRLLKIEENEPTLVYACTVKHGKFLATMMNMLGRKAASISSETNAVNRRALIKEFTEGKIDFLFNYGVLTTGFDAPKTKNVVICRPINSNILYEQIVGRGIRGSKFGGTAYCNVIDFSDNVYNLGNQQAYMRFKEYWDSEEEENGDKKEKEKE